MCNCEIWQFLVIFGQSEVIFFNFQNCEMLFGHFLANVRPESKSWTQVYFLLLNSLVDVCTVVSTLLISNSFKIIQFKTSMLLLLYIIL